MAWYVISKATQLGIEMVSPAFVGFFLGFYLDKAMGTGRWFTLVLLVLGILTGLRVMYREIRKIIKD
jgi:F0F1-type ATP synthase assembly protein I